ncbi:MAG: GNAT family N-acetyltransferase [Eubacteriales bacterium]|nr:GNAT family N-acetyltransferase [Eubacteriales bacterium]
MVIIRDLQANDVHDLQKNIFVRDSLEDVNERVLSNIEKVKRGEVICLVAVLDGEVVGNAMLTLKNHPLYSHRCVWDDVVVCHRFWRKGIARSLLEACEDRAHERQIKIIEVGVRGGEPAEDVYRKLGFVEYSRLPQGIIEPWSGNVFDEVWLYKSI